LRREQPGTVRAPGYFNWDFGVGKKFYITERHHFDFRAEFFNFSNTQPGTDWFAIIDNDKYFAEMVKAMISFGYCSRYDGEELVVKKSNEFTEHYDIFAGEGYIRRGPGAYRSSCFPAAF